MDYPNNITLDRLRYFSKAAQLEHVGLAARALHVTPSAISSAIKILEQELGQPLFYREKQRIRLTEEGRRLLNLAERILSETANLKENLSLAPTKPSGHFRIGASHFLMKEHLVHAACELSSSHPGLTFELTSLDTGAAVTQVQSGLLDCALVFRSSYKEKVLESVLWNGNFQIAVKRGHSVLRHKVKDRIAKLSAHPAIAFRTAAGGNFWELHPALSGLGLIPHNRFFYDDTEIAVKLLEKTSGWAFLPEIVIDSDPRLRSLTQGISLKAPVNISLVRSESERVRNLMPHLILIIQKSLQK